MNATVKQQAQEIGNHCLAVRLRKLNRIISSIYDDAIRPFGITIAQFNLLVSIAARGKTSPSKLAQTLSLEKSTVSRNIDKMKKNGWVTLHTGEDKRSHLVSHTVEGGKLLKKATPTWKQAQKEASKVLGPLTAHINSISIE